MITSLDYNVFVRVFQSFSPLPSAHSRKEFSFVFSDCNFYAFLETTNFKFSLLGCHLKLNKFGRKIESFWNLDLDSMVHN